MADRIRTMAYGHYATVGSDQADMQPEVKQ